MHWKSPGLRSAIGLGVLFVWSGTTLAQQVSRASADRTEVAVSDKLDSGLIAESERPLRVFVRMRDQLFVRGGDYAAFASQNRERRRRALRAEVLQTLRRKSKTSWTRVAARVETLGVEQVRRYWIVNGFACRATGAACTALAKLPEVEFIYLQKGGARQERIERPAVPAARAAQMRAVYRQVLSEWKDDSSQRFSTEGLSVAWNVSRIRADAVWKQERVWGQGVTVALLDSGLMVTPSLSAALWKNPREQLNQQDDDGNGLVDDIFGYDFGADSFYAIGDGARRTHGSMCAGIIAGRPLNALKLATGIAPRARLMILRGTGLLRSYEYALAQGADVVSMSYMYTQQNIGNYRGLYRLAHEHLAAAGVVSVGGAGTFGPSGRPSL
ncbi:MAG: S8 family serine peptidase, partial [Planctomycetaceae bacterium]